MEAALLQFNKMRYVVNIHVRLTQTPLHHFAELVEWIHRLYNNAVVLDELHKRASAVGMVGVQQRAFHHDLQLLGGDKLLPLMRACGNNPNERNKLRRITLTYINQRKLT